MIFLPIFCKIPIHYIVYNVCRMFHAIRQYPTQHNTIKPQCLLPKHYILDAVLINNQPLSTVLQRASPSIQHCLR